MDILNLGCGNKLMTDPGSINHDLTKHRPEVDVAWDLNELPWPWADNSFDSIVAASVLEHLRINLVESLDECWRILRPEGTIHLKLPFWEHANAYADPTHYWRFGLNTLDYFDPTTKLGSQYGFYTTRKWKIVKRANLNQAESSIIAAMGVRK